MVSWGGWGILILGSIEMGSRDILCQVMVESKGVN